MWYTIGNKGQTMPHIRLRHSVALIRCRCRWHRRKKNTPDIRQPILWHCPSTGLAHLYKQRGLADQMRDRSLGMG